MTTTTSFPFVPRKVAKRQHVLPTTAPSTVSTSTSQTVAVETVGKENGKRRSDTTPYSDEDYAILVSLALSDQALWSNPDLRRKIGEQDGYIPLNYLLQHSPAPVRTAGSAPTRTEVVLARALRACAQGVLDVRLRVAGGGGGGGATCPAASSEVEQALGARRRYEREWQGGGGGGGCYEVRRKDWEEEGARRRALGCCYSKNDWEVRTVYLENIPLAYRTVPGIARFVSSLLPATTEEPAPAPGLGTAAARVQSVTLPPHLHDRPGDERRCKGFALVTLSSVEDTETLVREWPWERRVPPSAGAAAMEKGAREGGEEGDEARRYGLRALAKRRWDELKGEYEAYRQRLVLESLAFQDDARHEESPSPSGIGVDLRLDVDASSPTSSEPAFSSSSPFPVGCLVFVRNVHPDTNKTTLRGLFSRVLGSQGDGLDYVDFNKGIDSCHLRLKLTAHARTLVDHFNDSSHPISQSHGLDDTGGGGTTTLPITMEIVRGRREEVYWEKVPEKVRRQAVLNAISAQGGNGAGGGDGGEVGVVERKKRKRSDK